MLGALAELACEKVGYRHVLPRVDVDESICITLLYPDSMKNHFIHPAKLDTGGQDAGVPVSAGVPGSH